MADGRVIIDTEVDSSGAEKDVGKLGNKLTKVGSTMAKGVGVALKGTAVAIGTTATAIGALGTQSVKLYSEYEQLVGGVDTLFKESSKQVQKYAENAYKTAGISANKYMDTVTSFSASLISSVGGDTKKAADLANVALTDMSDNANKMGTSMDTVIETYQSLAKGNYAMLDNLKLGYGGTKSEMERLIKDAAKLDKSVDANSMSYGNMVKAIHAVQTKMGITGTTAKEASTTIQGSIGMMQASWENFLTGMADPNQDFDTLLGNVIDSVVTVGENLIPRIQMMLPRLIEGLTQLMNSLAPMIPGIIETALPALISGAMALLNGLIGAFPTLSTVLAQSVPMLISGLTSALPQIVTAGISIITELCIAILGMLPQLVDIGFELIVQLVKGLASASPQTIDAIVECLFGLIDAIIDNLPLIVEAGLELILALCEGLIDAIPNIVDRVPEIIDSIISTLLSLIPEIIDAGVELLTALTEDLPTILNAICDAIPLIVEAIVSNIESLVPLLIDAGVELFIALVKNLPVILAVILLAVSEIFAAIVGSLIEAKPRLKEAGYKLLIGIVEKIGEACKWIGGKVKTVVTAMKEAITSKIKEFTTIGKQIVEGVWQGIKGMKATITKNIKNFFGGIVDSAKEKLGIHSPSRVFEKEVGIQIAQGVIKGMQKKYKQVKLSAKQMANLIYESAKTRFDYYTKYNDMTLSNEVAYWQKIVSQTKKGTQGYKDAMLEYKNAKSELNEQVAKLDEQYASSVAKVKEDLIKNIQAVTEEYEKAVESRKNSILNSMDIFKTFESTTENTSESILTNMENQVNALNEWDMILDSLEARGLSSAIIEDLQSMGVSQLADLRLLYAMTEEELAQFSSLYDQKNVIASERAIQELSDMRHAAETEIQELIKEANTELDRLESDYMKGLAELGVKSVDKSKSIGKDIVNGLKDGIKSQQAELQSFLSSFFNSIMSSAKASLSVSAPQIANTVLAGNTNGTSIASTINNNNQVVNVYQPVSTPDEMARAARLETRYA